MGLTFKPETDDMRDSPSLAIIPNLVDKGAVIQAHDPQGVDEARQLLPQQVGYFENVFDAVKGADVVVLMTEWNEYRGLDLARVKQLMKGDAFVDLRNVYESEGMHDLGFRYTCIGRASDKTEEV
jgi:UDPglucose 6-dehydrogenase